jgi:RNA polymerase sigma-70 factor (ECF subfamily)
VAIDRAALEDRIRELLDGGHLAEAATKALKGYGPEILGYLVSIIRDDSAARDIFGEFSEDLWKGLGSFRKQSSFRTWAYKVAWNAAQMYWRDPYRRRVRRIETDEYSLLAEKLRVSSVRSDPSAKAGRLAELRASLQPDEQTLLILRVDKGLSWKEIAEILAGQEGEAPSAPAALRKRFERLKERLVLRAEEDGLLDSDSRGRAR